MIGIYVLIVVVAAMFVLAFIQAKRYEKSGTIYYKRESKEKLLNEYDRQLEAFPVPYRTHNMATKFGKVHVIECGNKEGEKLVMFHAASVGAVSWKNNVAELGMTYHLFLIDTLGEGNKSELYDVHEYPKTSLEVADLYKYVMDTLQIDRASIIGASYGGFICLNVAYHYPDRVDKIILCGPMGIAKSVIKVILKLTFYSFYPYKIFRKPMARWAFGESPLLEDAKKYFNIVLEGLLGRYFAPRTFEQSVLCNIKNPVLLILGKKDNLVGDVNKAIDYASSIPELKVEVLDSGHLINVEQWNSVNTLVLHFLKTA